jgi:hypothetical protein
VPQIALQRETVQEFQFKESSRYKKIEEKPAEAKTWGIDHGSREVVRKTSSRRVKFKGASQVFWAVTTAEGLLQFAVVVTQAKKFSCESEPRLICHATTRS